MLNSSLKIRFIVFGIALALMISFARPAQAAGTVSVSVGCSVITVSGITTAPIAGTVTVRLGYWRTYTSLYNGPVTVDAGGHFAYTYNVPAALGAKEGDLFAVEVLDGGGSMLFLNEIACHNPVVQPSGNGIEFNGPSVPAGFVLKTITCNVAVFDGPGGHAVGGSAIKGGQTWFVNPKPRKDAAGRSWTEIFVGGYGNGFVPTRCVH